ncbi:hypothetical protein AFR_39355 [Actinoplanes friuliensis DSM 7358]|uniref:Uncharacterized protein n=1 Tax=Actinoplanes friuliensis DSM 7358 TaxID=1246995 RepID=U5WDN5_9ACTN|nr:hypothetical protein AFR_39355 [Actinoplanes friuliensis DSM 7358]
MMVLLRSYMMTRAWLFSCSCWADVTGGLSWAGVWIDVVDLAGASFLACQARFFWSFASYWSRIGFSLWRARLSVSVTVEKAR